jgi:hypothetical protein
MNESPQLWPKLLLRLQTISYDSARSKGLAVLSVKLILVNGELRAWAEPCVTGIEPGAAKEELLALIVAEG